MKTVMLNIIAIVVAVLNESSGKIWDTEYSVAGIAVLNVMAKLIRLYWDRQLIKVMEKRMKVAQQEMVERIIRKEGGDNERTK